MITICGGKIRNISNYPVPPGRAGPGGPAAGDLVPILCISRTYLKHFDIFWYMFAVFCEGTLSGFGSRIGHGAGT